MPPRLRKLALALHVTVSVSWIGAVAAYLTLDVAAATSEDVQTLRAAYLSMELVARYAVVPLALAALVTGLVMALGTRWGLFRHYWVVLSLLLTLAATVVLLLQLGPIGSFAAAARDPQASAEHLRGLRGTLVHSVGGLLVLLTVLTLNVYKPPGVTPYGWRRQRAQRRDPQAHGLDR